MTMAYYFCRMCLNSEQNHLYRGISVTASSFNKRDEYKSEFGLNGCWRYDKEGNSNAMLIVVAKNFVKNILFCNE